MQQIIRNAVWAVVFLANGDTDCIIASGLVKLLVPLLGHHNHKVQVRNKSSLHRCCEQIARTCLSTLIGTELYLYSAVCTSLFSN